MGNVQEILDVVKFGLSESTPENGCAFQNTKPPPGAYDKFVTLEVGLNDDETKIFYMYRGLLSFHSGYFNRLLNGSGFTDSGSDHVRVRTVSIQTFESIHYWFNSGSLYDSSDEGRQLRSQTIMEIYVFGDMYIIPRLKNAAVEACIEKSTKHHSWPHVSRVRYLFKNTSGECGMRSLLVIILADAVENFDTDEAMRYPTEFLLKVIEAIRYSEGYLEESQYRQVLRNVCEFHDHVEPNPPPEPSLGK